MADAIEVVQSVQDLTNRVPLVAGKRTFVRFHAHSNGAVVSTMAELRVRSAAQSAVLAPMLAGGTLTVRPEPNRAALGDAALFQLPSGFEQGPIELTAVLNPAGDPAERTPANNTLSTTVSFEAVPPQTLVLARIGYTQDGTAHFPDDLDAAQLVLWLRKAFPLSRLQVIERRYVAGEGLPSCGEVNASLLAKRLWDLAFSPDLDSNARYYGMVSDAGGVMPGCAVGVPSFAASGPTGVPGAIFAWDTDGTYGDVYGAHEIAHAWGRPDAPFCGAEGPAYPYPGGRISAPLDGPQALFGLDAVTQAVYPPSFKDVTSFCAYQWVSDVTYEGLLDVYQNPGRIDRNANRTDRLLLAGTIEPVSGTIALQPLFVLPDTGELKRPRPGDYAIVLRDASGAQLKRYPFMPEVAAGGDPERTVDLLFIDELVPYDRRTARVDVEGPGGLLHSVSAGAGEPTVDVLAPAAGEILDDERAVVAWTASDADGDALFFDVQYSPDGGASWEMIEQNVTDTQVELDARNLVRGAQARFRVWASDGIHTAFGDSDAAVVPNRAPQVRILQPSPPATVGLGQTVALVVEAIDDATGGTMSDDQLEWRSSIDGLLGRRAALNVLACSPPSRCPSPHLSVGRHTITFTADDGAGGVAQAAVGVEVAETAGCTPTANVLAVEPLLLSFDPTRGEMSVPVSVSNRNCAARIAWHVVASPPWVELTEREGVTPSGLTASFRDTGLPPGQQTATVTFVSPDVPGRPLELPVEVTIAGPCPGDCDGDGHVAINELIAMVNIALGNAPLTGCLSGDASGNGAIEINEIIAAVDHALLGCPA